MSDRTITTLDSDFSWASLMPGDVVWVRKPIILKDLGGREWRIPGFDVDLRPNGYPLFIVGVDPRNTASGLRSTYVTLLIPGPKIVQIRKSTVPTPAIDCSK